MQRTQLRKWTEWLVKIESVVNTAGEATIAEKLYEELRGWTYFQRHPERLWLQPTDENREEGRKRYNVVALVKAEPDTSVGQAAVADTTLLVGHLDTVGIEDYGQLRGLATQPDELKEAWRKQMADLPEQAKQLPQVVKHLEDEDWMFGRGALDMKSGVAANLSILHYYSEHADEMKGNLMLVAECDEEDSSNGILSAVPFLNNVAEQEGLVINAAINSDFVTARYEDDPNRYVYMGTVGKLLPSFYVTGKETHVGQAFDGFDPNLVLSELTREIDYNTDLCDEMYGEVTPPPVSLKQTDLKPYYDVQTPLGGFVYYNFLVHSLSPREVMEKLRDCATRAFERAIGSYREQYLRYCEKIGQSAREITLVPRVYTYQEYLAYVTDRLGNETVQAALTKKMDQLNKTDVDIRWYCCRLVEELNRLDDDKSPVCIIFYSSLYSPRIALSTENERDQRLQRAVEYAVAEASKEYANPIEIRQFFPYISDMSFVALSDDEEGIEGYTANMPAWGNRHTVPFDEIRKLNLPIVNIGPYGFDAHKKWERVELTYSLEVVPQMMQSVIEHLWGKRG